MNTIWTIWDAMERKTEGIENEAESTLEKFLDGSISLMNSAPFVLGAASSYSGSSDIANLEGLYLLGLAGAASLTAMYYAIGGYNYFRKREHESGTSLLGLSMCCSLWGGLEVSFGPVISYIGGGICGDIAHSIINWKNGD